MPELPEVETVRRQLADRLIGHAVDRVIYHRPNLRFVLPAGLPAALQGRVCTKIHRHGKYMGLVFADAPIVMGVHLGMSGHFIHRGAGDGTPPAAHDHVEMILQNGARFLYHDPRRFGMIFACPADHWRAHPLLQQMGPDPIVDGLDPALLHAACVRRTGPIKVALLDQALIAGIGNIYASEALYVAHISPLRPASSLRLPDWQVLVAAIDKVLRQAISVNGSTYRDYRVLDGGVGRYQEMFKVYDKAGKPCPECDCQTGVKRVVQGGRATYYCSRKQK